MKNTKKNTTVGTVPISIPKYLKIFANIWINCYCRY